jgi:exosortase B
MIFRTVPDASARLANLARLTSRNRQVVLPFAIVFIGMCVLYGPTALDLFQGVWSTDRNAHGPIMLAVGLWFLYFKARTVNSERVPVVPAPVLGWMTTLIGLSMFVLGRSQSFYLFEVGSFVIVVLGLILLFFGTRVARHLWFGFFFLLFMVPLPSTFVDALTQPLKIAVSYASVNVLHWLDYPVARSGVIINIGQYQLLVADACSGLNSLFTLEALGLLYINIIRHESMARNALLAILIVPISFISNVTRVIVLSLITYHLGDAAGQGFLHGFSGLVLFFTALLLIIGVDSLLQWITVWSRKKSPEAADGKSA